MAASPPQLERAFLELLEQCTPTLRPSPRPLAKWVHVKKNQQQLKAVRDQKFAITLAMAMAREQYAGLDAYKTCRQLYEQDAVFREAPRLGGYWGQFDVVLSRVAMRSGVVRGTRVRFDRDLARRELGEIRDQFGGASFTYECRARLFGLALASKTLFLPDGIELKRLTLQEIDQRQPTMEPFMSSGWRDTQLGMHTTEARFHLTIPVDRAKDGAFFEAGNQALSKAIEVFGRLVDAVTVVVGAPITFGQVELLGGFTAGGRPLAEPDFFPGRAKLSRSTASRVGAMYKMLKDPSPDAVLGRALRRIVLGHRRRDLEDRLVDYVIAWEALLLTHDGSPLTQELSYRFAVNGSVLLGTLRARTHRRDLYRKMRSAYTARSCVVHGTDPTSLARALRAGGFQSLGELCVFLEAALRDTVFWLNALSPVARPYRKKGGWDELLWS